MPSAIQTLSFVTSAIAAGGSLQINQNIGPNWINIHKILITPSTSTSPLRAEIYTNSSFAAATRRGGYSVSVSGPIVDPMEDVGAGPVDRGQMGFIMPYEDDNGTGKLHLLIYNDHSISQTYTVTIYYSGRTWISAGSTVTLSPGNIGHDIHLLNVVDDTNTQRIEWYREGGAVATRKRVDFVAGNSNIVISAADNGTRVQYAIYGSGAANVRRTRWFSNVNPILGTGIGGVYDYDLDNQASVVFPYNSPGEVGFGFRIDDDFAISGSVLTGNLALVLVGAPIASPGTTNTKWQPQLRWKKNNGSLTGFTSGDTQTLSNNTQWVRFEGTNNIISPGSIAVNDWIEVRVRNNTALVSAAQVDFAVTGFGIEYTSSQ